MKSTWLGYAAAVVMAAGCAEDPQYINAPMGASFALEFNGAAPAPVVVTLPFRLETMPETMRRIELAAELGVAPDEIPFIRLDDVDLSIEWSMKNLEACDSEVTFSVNGGNQYWSYDPLVIQPDPDEPQPPPLLGRSAPIPVPASGLVTGVFREDQVLEASIDLELITRANYNSFRAGLEVNKDQTEVEILDPTLVPPETGVFMPRAMWGMMTSFSIAFDAQTTGATCGGSAHLILEFIFRARDHRTVVHDEGLDAPAAELIVFAPMVYDPLGILP